MCFGASEIYRLVGTQIEKEDSVLGCDVVVRRTLCRGGINRDCADRAEECMPTLFDIWWPSSFEGHVHGHPHAAFRCFFER